MTSQQIQSDIADDTSLIAVFGYDANGKLLTRIEGRVDDDGLEDLTTGDMNSKLMSMRNQGKPSKDRIQKPERTFVLIDSGSKYVGKEVISDCPEYDPNGPSIA